MATNPAITSRGNINGSYELRPGGTADTDQYRIADIGWITTNYYTYITGDQTSNRCPSPNQIFAEPHITTTSPTVVNSSTVNDGGSVSNNVGVASEVGMCLSTTTSTPDQYDTVIPQYSNVNVTAGYSWSGNLSYVFTPSVLYYMRAYVIYNGIYFYGTSVSVNTLVTTTTTTLGAGYYDCGYGCQYYAYYPGCTPCNPASTSTTTTTVSPLYSTISLNATSGNPWFNHAWLDVAITTNGVHTITAKGICWSSTNSSPTIESSDGHTSGTSGSVNFSATAMPLNASTQYYFRSYLTSDLGTLYSINTLTVTTASLSTAVIGDEYQGGNIFYFFQSGDVKYVPGQVHGIIASTSDQSSGVAWYNGTNINCRTSSFSTRGNGDYCTNTIVTTQGSGTYAAKICYDLSLNGWSDWYLPNRFELLSMHFNETAAFLNMSNAVYWGSSENPALPTTTVDCFDFNSNIEVTRTKNTTARVRAIRYF